MNRKMKTSGMLLCLALCAACSSDNNQSVVPQPPVVSYPLTIEVTENPLITDGQEARSVNRAAITTTPSLSAFNMNYVYGSSSTGKEHATKDGDGKWTSTGSWPNGAGYDGVVTWHASTAGTFYLNENNPYIDFTVEDLAANQKDLLVAKSSGTWSGTGGKLSFTFDHACTALRFYVKKATNLKDYTLKVSSIVLKNVVNKGKYYYSTGNGR